MPARKTAPKKKTVSAPAPVPNQPEYDWRITEKDRTNLIALLELAMKAAGFKVSDACSIYRKSLLGLEPVKPKE